MSESESVIPIRSLFFNSNKKIDQELLKLIRDYVIKRLKSDKLSVADVQLIKLYFDTMDEKLEFD